MGRPREHDDSTRQALLAAAEALLRVGGEEAISVRAVAERVGTSTRAVYSVFGSKEEMLFALAEDAFRLGGAMVDQVPESDDPLADIVEAFSVSRSWALEHPALYRLMYRLVSGSRRSKPVDRAARETLGLLGARVQRACDAGLLPDQDPDEVTLQCNALSEGLAAVSLRGLLRGADADRLARGAMEALVRGMSLPDKARRTS